MYILKKDDKKIKFEETLADVKTDIKAKDLKHHHLFDISYDDTIAKRKERLKQEIKDVKANIKDKKAIIKGLKERIKRKPTEYRKEKLIKLMDEQKELKMKLERLNDQKEILFKRKKKKTEEPGEVSSMIEIKAPRRKRRQRNQPKLKAIEGR